MTVGIGDSLYRVLVSRVNFNGHSRFDWVVFSQLAALLDGRWRASANGHARMDYLTADKRSKAGLVKVFDRPYGEGSCWESDCHPPRSGLQSSNVSWNGYRIERAITSVQTDMKWQAETIAE